MLGIARAWGGWFPPFTTLARLVCCAGPGRFSPHSRVARVKKLRVRCAEGHVLLMWVFLPVGFGASPLLTIAKRIPGCVRERTTNGDLLAMTCSSLLV